MQSSVKFLHFFIVCQWSDFKWRFQHSSQKPFVDPHLCSTPISYGPLLCSTSDHYWIVGRIYTLNENENLEAKKLIKGVNIVHSQCNLHFQSNILEVGISELEKTNHDHSK